MDTHPADKRRRPRISTMILAEIRIGAGEPELARVRDLSESGVRIAAKLQLKAGQHLRIRLPGAREWTLARVAWVEGGVAGLSFLRAIDLPGLATLRPTLRIGAGMSSAPDRLAG
jgi:hypothetical protein